MRWDRHLSKILMALFALGILLRLAFILNPRFSMWEDEIWRAFFLKEQGMWATTFQHPNNLNALGFNLIGGFAEKIGGAYDQVFQGSMLLVALVSLFIFYRVLKSFSFSSLTVLVISICFLFNQEHIYFSQEYKPYVLDILCISLLLYWWRFEYPKAVDRLYFIKLGLLGSFCFIFSYVTLFFWPCLLALVIKDRERFWHKTSSLVGVLVCGFLLLSLGIAFKLLQLSSLELTPLTSFWEEDILANFDLPHLPGAIFVRSMMLFSYCLGASRFMTLAWFIFGFFCLYRSKSAKTSPLNTEFRQFHVIFWPALVTLVILSMVGKWPYGNVRSNLFFLPFTLLLFAFLAEFIFEFIRPRKKYFMLGILIIFAVDFLAKNSSIFLFEKIATTPIQIPDSMQKWIQQAHEDPETSLLYDDCYRFTHYRRYHPRFKNVNWDFLSSAHSFHHDDVNLAELMNNIETALPANSHQALIYFDFTNPISEQDFSKFGWQVLDWQHWGSIYLIKARRNK
jgi:hypothetical protein